jgi:SAM-dependent methyltransferase
MRDSLMGGMPSMPPAEPWRPHGLALRDFFRGDRSAMVVVHSDLEESEELPVAVWFREPADFFPLDHAALEMCRGRVLDVGAGTGCHSLVLQERGLSVCAIDFVPEAVEIMRARGVRDARLANVFELEEEPFDTVLLLSNGAGIAENLPGLDRLLQRLNRLVASGGQVLLDSADVRSKAAQPGGLTREDGRYVGEILFRLEYRGQIAPPFAQLYVDPDTLATRAAAACWSCRIVARAEPAYLAQLARKRDE